MADIVSTLFGINTPAQDQVQTYRDTQAGNIGSMWGLATLNPYDKNINADAYVKSQQAQAQLGNRLGTAIGGMFGVEDPMLKKATSIEQILQETQQELGAEVNDPVKMYGTLYNKLSQGGFTREAMQVGQLAQKAVQEQGLNQAKIENEKAQTAKYLAEAGKASKEDRFKVVGNNIWDNLSQDWITAPDSKTKVETPEQLATKLIQTITTTQDPVERETAQQQLALVKSLKTSGGTHIVTADDGTVTTIFADGTTKDMGKIGKTGKSGTEKALSGREARYADNVAIAGNEAIVGLQNIVNLPSTVTGGFWGSGVGKMQQGTGLFEAPIGALKNNMTNEATQRYNSEISKIGKFYSTMTNGGLQSSVTDMQTFENQFRVNEGDKPLTALTKLAQMRQTFERAAEIKINSKSTPEEQVDLWKEWLDQVKVAIPITVNDINKLANERDGTKTFADILNKKQEVSFTPENKLNPKQEKYISQAIEAVAKGSYTREQAVAKLNSLGVKVK
jgi:hypothetical protein